jgi:hypothetical protein
MRKESRPLNEYYDELMQWYLRAYKKKREKKTKQCVSQEELYNYQSMINIFVESFLYEPGNYRKTLQDDFTQQLYSIYVHKNLPSSLHPYNQEFARPNDNIEVIPPVDCYVDV